MGNSASNLPFSIGGQVSAMDSDGWTLHEGQQKSDGTAVTVFVAKKPALVKLNLLPPALHHFSNCKKYRHPHILNVQATLDTDDPNAGSDNKGAAAASAANSSVTPSTGTTGDLIIVTEPCIPFGEWLKQDPPPEELAWGLEGVVRSLHFLHTSANLSHCNVCPSSLYVTKAGDVKLWNFSLLTAVATASGGLHRVFLDYGSRITPRPYQSPERTEQRWDAIQTMGTSHNMDAYSLGVLIADFYGGQIPGPLQKAVQRLQTPNIKMRPRLQPLLKCPLFDTPYQKTQLQLLEFAVQPVEAKIEFWTNLLPSLQAQLVPTQMAVYKILPLMKTSVKTICSSDSIRSQDLYRKEVLMILPPMFYIAEQYLAENFSKELSAMIAMLFSINDRGIRGSLLKKVAVLAKFFDNHTLNVSVFEPMCSGFSDSSGALRELTLKSALSLVPHLTAPNMEKLSRYLVRLQNDEEAAIRTNTVYFFVKLAPHLTEMTRQKILLPAFVRALKDPFTPCRMAALQSTLQAKQFFDPQCIANKVLPAVMPCCVDPSFNVRKEAFSAVEELLYMLRQESERLSKLPEENNYTTGGGEQPRGVVLPGNLPAPVLPTTGGVPGAPTTRPSASPVTVPAAKAQTTPAAVVPPPSSGGYFTSWMSTSKKTAAVAPPALPPPPSVEVPPPPPLPVNPPSSSTPARADHGWGDEDDDGGGDGWGDDDDGIVAAPPRQPVPPKPVTVPTVTPVAVLSRPAKEEDDFFGSAFSNESPPKPVVVRKAAVGKLKVPSPSRKTSAKPAPKPAVTKLAATKDDEVADGWDDF